MLNAINLKNSYLNLSSPVPCVSQFAASAMAAMSTMKGMKAMKTTKTSPRGTGSLGRPKAKAKAVNKAIAKNSKVADGKNSSAKALVQG